MVHKIYHYPIWVRIWHLLNALLCLTLIISGLSMQYSNPSNEFIRFDYAVTIHNTAGVLLSINYLFFLIGNIFSKNIKHYKIHLKGFTNQLSQQIKYYTFGIFKGEKPPFPINEERKFNPLQKLSYSLIMYIIVPLVFVSGWGLLFPEIIINRIFSISGLLLTDLLHITAGFIISIFLFIHVYFCTTGLKWGSIFKSMINGWSEVH